MANLNQVLIADILAGRNPYQRPINPYSSNAVNPYAPSASGFTPSAPAPSPQAAALQANTAMRDDIASQRLRAAELSKRSMESPGIVTSGRMSAPGANWMTVLAQGINGYGARKAREKASALSTTLAAKEEAAAQAAAELDAAAVAEDARRDERDFKYKQGQDAEKAKRLGLKNARAAEAHRVAMEEAQRRLDSPETISTMEMINPETGETFEAFTTLDGVFTADSEGNAMLVDQTANRRITDEDRELIAAGGVGGVAEAEDEKSVGTKRYEIAQSLGSATERGRANLYIGVGEQLNEIMKQGNKILASGNEPHRLKSYAGDVAKIFTPSFSEEAASNTATELAYDDDQMNFLSNLDNAVGDLRKARTGANVTSIETELGKNWDPTVKGITFSEKLRRAEQLQKYLVNTSLRGYGIEEFDVVPVWKPGVSTVPDDSDGWSITEAGD